VAPWTYIHRKRGSTARGGGGGDPPLEDVVLARGQALPPLERMMYSLDLAEEEEDPRGRAKYNMPMPPGARFVPP